MNHIIKKIALISILMVCLTNAYAQDQQDMKVDTTSIDPVTGFAKGTKFNLIDTTEQDVVFAKDEQAFVSLMARAYQDSIVLRWAPSSRVLWHVANHTGYVIERVYYEEYEIQDSTNIPEDYATLVFDEIVTAQNPIKPYDSTKWAPFFPNNDKYALIAAGAVAGDLELNQDEVGFGVKAQQDQSIFGIVLMSADLSQLAADGLGLRFVDHSAVKGRKYQYRVAVADSAYLALADSILKIDPIQLYESGDTATFKKVLEWQQRGQAYLDYTGSTSFKPKEVSGFKTVPGDSSIVLRWDGNDGVNEYTGYLIEKSLDGIKYDTLAGGLYVGEPVTVSDSTSDESNEELVYEFVDRIEQNYVQYYYRITGIDAFADKSVSVVATGMGRDVLAPKNPIIKSGAFIENKGIIELTYKVPEVPDDFKDLYFEYTNHHDSTYVRYEPESIDPYDSIYQHATAPGEYSHYFRLAMSDTSGNRSYSFPIFVNIPDTIPPPVPTEIHAVIDTLGEVEIKWTDEHVDEQGFLGYRLFYSNSPNHEFTQLTSKPIIANFFIYHLPLNTLTDKIYYKVQAVDKSYNHSKFSEVAEAIKPDIIPPVTPVFKSIKSTETNIKLEWTPSSSRDVVRQILKRRNGDQVIQIQLDDAKLGTYVDSLVEKGTMYEYRLQAIDDFELRSEWSFPLRGKVIDRKRMPTIENLKIKYNKEDQTVKIKWVYEEDQGDIRYLIYRNKDSENVKSYKSIGKDQKEYRDLVKQPGTYYYAIRVMNKNGSKSLLSESVKVTVN